MDIVVCFLYRAFCLELALLAFLGLHGDDDEVDELNRHVTRGNRAHVIKVIIWYEAVGVRRMRLGKAAK